MISMRMVCAYAQSWFPAGATWYHGYGLFNIVGYERMVVGADTTIEGQPCKRLDRWLSIYDYITAQYSSGPDEPLFAFEQNGIVWIKDQSPAPFDTLYDMHAGMGARWQLPLRGFPVCDSTSWMQVTDTGTVVINSVPLHRLSVEIHLILGGAPSPVITDTVLERIGTTWTYLRSFSICDPQIDVPSAGRIRCYHDAQIDYSTDIAAACDFILSLPVQPDHTCRVGVFPNPAANRLHIVCPTDRISYYEVLDPQGHTLVRRSQISGQDVDVSALAPGCYMLRLYDAQKTILGSARFIKE